MTSIWHPLQNIYQRKEFWQSKGSAAKYSLKESISERQKWQYHHLHQQVHPDIHYSYRQGKRQNVHEGEQIQIMQVSIDVKVIRDCCYYFSTHFHVLHYIKGQLKIDYTLSYNCFPTYFLVNYTFKLEQKYPPDSLCAFPRTEESSNTLV